MKRNMTQWIEDMISSPVKKAMPILSFPAISKMDITVRELISNSDLQAKAMEIVASNTNAAASVSFMDLSVEAQCFGSEIRVSDEEVPTVIGILVNSEEDADALAIPEVGSGRTNLYIEAIKISSETITDRPVLAGVIGPFSLAGRLMDVSEAMIYCYEEPDMVHTVLSKTTAFIINYAKAFKASGANGVVIAEPLAGLLSPDLAKEFSADYVKRIVDELQDDYFKVIYHNCGNGTVSQIDSIIATGAPLVHFGNAIDIRDMVPHIPKNVIFAGNIDPSSQFKNGTPESIKNDTLNLLNDIGTLPNFLISSGCDIPPLSKWENIDSFFNTVDTFYSNK
ncbi:MAG: uroporphyrinogen decarboxylase family protein [Suipraeoptans sp.]